MPKWMRFDEDARNALIRGVEQLTRAVQVTLGPKGRLVMLDRPQGSPLVSSDGVSIAQEIELEDPFEDMGAQLLREVAQRTNEVVGDGTTTATVLAYALVSEAQQAMRDGVNPVDLVRGLEHGLRQALDALCASSAPVTDSARLAQVAAIAANDAHVGQLVAEALHRVGTEGTITVEPSPTGETRLEVEEGLAFDRGYVTAHMATHADESVADLSEPAILVTDQTVQGPDDASTLIRLAEESGKPLLVIADEVRPMALPPLLRRPDGPPIVVVHPPEFGQWRRAALEDIAIATGARLLARDLGDRLDAVQVSDLGSARRARITADRTVIFGAEGAPDAIRGRVQLVRRQLAEALAPIEQDKLRWRLSLLSGRTAVLYAGGATAAERKARQQRMEDALNAARSALRHGVVPGGGAALVHVAAALEGRLGAAPANLQPGYRLMIRALTYPLRTLVRNTGGDPDRVLAHVLAGPPSLGYDALTGTETDLVGAGVLDPVQVVMTALENAASVASLILRTDALITDKPEVVDVTAGPARGGGAERLGMD